MPVIIGLVALATVGFAVVLGYVFGAAVKERTLTETDGIRGPYRDPAMVEMVKRVSVWRVLAGVPHSAFLFWATLCLLVAGLFSVSGLLFGDCSSSTPPAVADDGAAPQVALQPIDVEKMEIGRIERLFLSYDEVGSIEPVSDQVRELNFTRLAYWVMATGDTWRRQSFFCEAVRVRNRSSDQATMAGWLRGIWSLQGGNDPDGTARRIRLRLLCLMALERVAPADTEVLMGVMLARSGDECGNIFSNDRQACSERIHIESHARRVLATWFQKYPDELHECFNQH